MHERDFIPGYGTGPPTKTHAFASKAPRGVMEQHKTSHEEPPISLSSDFEVIKLKNKLYQLEKRKIHNMATKRYQNPMNTPDSISTSFIKQRTLNVDEAVSEASFVASEIAIMELPPVGFRYHANGQPKLLNNVKALSDYFPQFSELDRTKPKSSDVLDNDIAYEGTKNSKSQKTNNNGTSEIGDRKFETELLKRKSSLKVSDSGDDSSCTEVIVNEIKITTPEGLNSVLPPNKTDNQVDYADPPGFSLSTLYRKIQSSNLCLKNSFNLQMPITTETKQSHSEKTNMSSTPGFFPNVTSSKKSVTSQDHSQRDVANEITPEPVESQKEGAQPESSSRKHSVRFNTLSHEQYSRQNEPNQPSESSESGRESRSQSLSNMSFQNRKSTHSAQVTKSKNSSDTLFKRRASTASNQDSSPHRASTTSFQKGMTFANVQHLTPEPPSDLGQRKYASWNEFSTKRPRWSFHKRRASTGSDYASRPIKLQINMERKIWNSLIKESRLKLLKNKVKLESESCNEKMGRFVAELERALSKSNESVRLSV